MANRPYRNKEQKHRWVLARMRQLSYLEGYHPQWFTGREIAERAGYKYNWAFRETLYQMVDDEKLQMFVMDSPNSITGCQYYYAIMEE